MADATTVVEGKVKYREGKKWKSRWCILKKPSPVADRLQLVLYKDVHEALKVGGKVKTSFPLDGYLGLESGFVLERESNVLALICLKHVTLLAFDTREYLIQFEVKIRRSLGQEYQFPVRPVKVPSGSRLPLDSVKLLIHGAQFCVTAHVPPKLLQVWNVADLRRFGAVDGKFCFEGGSMCGKGAGVHAIQASQAEEISEILRVNTLGKSAMTSRSLNRSSQLMDHSLPAPPDPIWPQNNPDNSPAGGAGAVGGERCQMLMCCQGLLAAGDGGGDEWGCRKRHSVSITEFQRASVATFHERLRQMSLQQQDSQRLMAIYDVPPKITRKLEAASGSNNAAIERGAEHLAAASSMVSLDSGQGMVGPSQLMVKLDVVSRITDRVEAGHSIASSQTNARRVVVVSEAGGPGREYCIPRSLNTSVFDSIVSARVDSTKRSQALQSLQRQETHLQQEIVLLDEMLQSCHSTTEEPDGKIPEKRDTLIDANDPWHDRIGNIEPPKCSTPAFVSQKATSLPPKVNNIKDSVQEENAVRKPGTFSSSFAHNHSVIQSSESASPDLISKVFLNSPLPYVNLAKYDAPVDTDFIYMLGNEESVCRSVKFPKLCRNNVGGSLASLRNRVAQSCMPHRSLSETHLGSASHVGLAPQKPLPLPPREESEGELDHDSDGLAASTKILHIEGDDEEGDDDVLMPPTTLAPPIPCTHSLISTASISCAQAVTDSPPSMHAPPVPTMSIPLPVSAAIREPIYANTPPPPLPPPRNKPDTTPPPVLPPKGPGLLHRKKMRSSGSGASLSTSVPPAPPVRTRSLSVGSQGKVYEYDNQPDTSPPPPIPPKRADPEEDNNYLPMVESHKSQSCFDRTPVESSNSRPCSLYVVNNSPKSRAATGHRGNADVLSGYMDMANMFVEEPKNTLDDSFPSDSEFYDPKELHISQPAAESGADSLLSPDSNYMEMSSFPTPTASSSACALDAHKRKSTVLKNLEALQTYVSSTPAGDSSPRPSIPSRTGTPTTPGRSNTPSVVCRPSSSTPNTPPVTTRSTKVYIRAGSSNSLDGKLSSPSRGSKPGTPSSSSNTGAKEKQRTAMPFTNLKSFELNQPKSSYVNTYIPVTEVPLPEPPKKEEGFFARLIRRNSKDKSGTATQSTENLNVQKHRTSVFERSMSESGKGAVQAVAEEKVNSKLKVGRRRSASFPNRLSFQETTPGATPTSNSKKDAIPPLPPPFKSSSSRSTSSVKSSSSSTKSSSKLGIAALYQVSNSKPLRPDSRSDNSSVHELSDDSDLAPLLRQGNARGSSAKTEMRVLTVLHMQQDITVNPLAIRCSDAATKCSLSKMDSFSNCADLKSPISADSFSSLSDLSKADSTATVSESSSSKTDDEKLIELLQSGKIQSAVSDESERKNTSRLPIESRLSLSPVEEAAAIARHVASIPPFIPAKTKRLPLSPVSEVNSPEGTSPPPASCGDVPPPAPPEHPRLPSAPNEDEAIYMDMKELFPHPPRGPASPTLASQHPYNSPRQQKEHAKATLRIAAAVEDENGHIWVPRHNRDPGGIRVPPLAMMLEPPPPLPGLSPSLPPSYTSQISPSFGAKDVTTNLYRLHYTTPLVVSVEQLDVVGEELGDCLSLSSRISPHSLRSMEDAGCGTIRSSPAATVLRPRSGKNYQVVRRKRAGSEAFASPASSPQISAHSAAALNSVFTYETESVVAFHRSPASVSLCSWHSRDKEPSPGGEGISLTHCSTPSSLTREITPPAPRSATVFRDNSLESRTPPQLPPRRGRGLGRTLSEPGGCLVESPLALPCRSASPSSSRVPNLSISSSTLAAAAPELLEPILNYAEIDLTAAASTPPPAAELSRHLSRRQKRLPPKPQVIEYTQIDHNATSALKRAGQMHAQSREDNNSLRRGANLGMSRKNSSLSSTKDRKQSSSSSKEHKLSTCSVDVD